MQRVRPLMDIVYSTSPENPVRAINKKRALEAWDVWLNLWDLVNQPLEDDTVPGRTARASEVASSGKLLVHHMRGLGISRSIYPHLFIKHIPDSIILFGNIRKYAGDGIELCHQGMKDHLHKNTNKQPLHRTSKLLSIDATLTKLEKTRTDGEREWEHQRLITNKNVKHAYEKNKRTPLPPMPALPVSQPVSPDSTTLPPLPCTSLPSPVVLTPPTTPRRVGCTPPPSTTSSPVKKKPKRPTQSRKSHTRL